MFDPFLSDYRPKNSRVAVFGDLGGQKTLADVQDFLESIQYRMQQMRLALGQLDPSRVENPGALASLMVDAGNLMSRVNGASEKARIALASAKLSPLTLPSYVAAQGTFDALLHAMKQGAPPDGAAIQRGDYDDVANRIAQLGKSRGVRVDLSQMPQPKASDHDRNFLVATAPLAHTIDAIGKEAAKQADDVFDFYRWMSDHKLEIALVAGILGLWVLHESFAVAKAAAPILAKATPLAAL